jgi:hypothetical protein
MRQYRIHGRLPPLKGRTVNSHSDDEHFCLDSNVSIAHSLPTGFSHWQWRVLRVVEKIDEITHCGSVAKHAVEQLNRSNRYEVVVHTVLGENVPGEKEPSSLIL